MSTPTLEKLTWVLIYGGLFAACLGLFVQAQDAGFGLAMMAGGVLATAIGALLVWLRSRR